MSTPPKKGITRQEAGKQAYIGTVDGNGTFSKVSFPSDVEVGFAGVPANLQLDGGLLLSVTDLTVAPGTTSSIPASNVVTVVKHTAAATLKLPAASRQGIYVIVKDGSGNAATSNIIVTTQDLGVALKIDGNSSTIINNNYGFKSFVSMPNGQWAELPAGVGGGGATADSYFSSSIAGSIFTTGSTSFSGLGGVTSPSQVGSDVFFYVSGSSSERAVFGGDVYISGSLHVSGGISGSITTLLDGTPFLIAGSNVLITTGANGAITIAAVSATGSGVPGGSIGEVQYNAGAGSFGGISKLTYDGTNLFGTGSFTGSFKGEFTGSLTKLTSGNPYIVGGTGIVTSTGSVGDVTITLSNTGSAGTYGSASQVPVFVTNAQGRVTSVTNTSIQIAESQVTSLTSDLSSRALTSTTISAGAGLTGGGDLSANRTISLATTGTAGTYGSSTQVPVLTTNAYGQVTTVSLATISGISPTGSAGGDLTGSYPNPTLITVGTASTYGSANVIPVFTTDAQGRVTTVTPTSASISASQITAGTLPIARGGTGLSTAPTNGQLLIGNGSGFTESTITPGTGILISNGAGSITASVDTSTIATLSGATFTGPVVFSGGLSGSLTRLPDGSPYLLAGPNITINTGSNGAVSITGSTTPPGGSNTQVQFNDNGAFSGSSLFTFQKSTGAVTASYFVGDGGSLTNLTASQVYVSGAAAINGYLQLLPVGNVVIPTNQTASYIYTSGSTNDMYFTQYLPGTSYTNTTRLRWLESAMHTGLLRGCNLSTQAGTTTFSMTSGSGLIVSQNVTPTSEPYPTINYVSIPAVVSQSLIYTGSSQITYIGADSSGSIVQRAAPFTDGDYLNYVVIGKILHQSGSVTNAAVTYPVVSYAGTQELLHFARAFGPLKISGHFLEASGSTLGLIKSAGDAYAEGRNYTYNANDPNYVASSSDTAVNTSKIFRVYVSGSTEIIDTGIGNAGYTVVNPTLYNSNGTLTPLLNNNRCSIQRVYWFPNSVNRAFYVYYGSAQYTTLDEAQAAIATENFTEGNNTKTSAILVGYVILFKNTTDLSNTTSARIIQAGLFRGGGGGVGGGGGGSTLPGGSDTQVQFNDGGTTFGGDSGLTFNKTTNVLAGSDLTVQAAGGLSGSLTKLADGSSYLLAGPNISIVTQSNGSVAITGSIGGSNSQIQFNDGGLFSGSSNLTYDKSSSTLFLSGTFLLNTSSAAYYENFSVNQVVTSSGATSLTKMGAFFNQVLTGSDTDSSILFGLVSYSTNKSDLPYGLIAGQSVGIHQSTSSISSIWGLDGVAAVSKPDNSDTAGGVTEVVGLFSGVGFDENLTGSIFNSHGLRYNNFGISSDRTVTNSYGVRLGNVGAAQGVTNAIGVEVESINTASGIKLGVRTQDPIVIGTTNVTGSEKLRVYGASYFDGAAKFPGGLSGSLTNLANGSPYLVAGPNIAIVTQSNGSIAISGTTPTFYQWNELSPSPRLNTTASVAIAGGLGSSYAAQSAGSDVFFFVSGSSTAKSVFGGDVVTSGSLFASGTTINLVGSNSYLYADNQVLISASAGQTRLSLSTGSIVTAIGNISASHYISGSNTYAITTNSPLLIRPDAPPSGSGAGRDLIIGASDGAVPGVDLPGALRFELGTRVPTVSGAPSGEVQFYSGPTKIAYMKASFTDRYWNFINDVVNGGIIFSSLGSGGATQALAQSFVSVAVQSTSGFIGLQGLCLRRSDNTYQTIFEDSRLGSAAIAAATTTNIVTYDSTGLSNRVWEVEGHMTVANGSVGEGAVYWLRAAFKSISGSMSQIGSTQTVAPNLVDTNQAGLVPILDYSGQTIRLRLTTDTTGSVAVAGNLMLRERIIP